MSSDAPTSVIHSPPERLRQYAEDFVRSIWERGDFTRASTYMADGWVGQLNPVERLSANQFFQVVTAWLQPLRSREMRVDAVVADRERVAGRGTIRARWVGPDGLDDFDFALHAAIHMTWRGSKCTSYRHEVQVHCPALNLIAGIERPGTLQMQGMAHDKWSELPPRMREVAELVLAGESDKRIADALGLSKHTAQTYVKALRTHFGVKKRTQLFATLSLVVAR